MSPPCLLTPIGAAFGCATALRSDALALNAWTDGSPWRTACDRLDAAPRTFDLAVVVGLCLALTVARAMTALQRWRRRSR